MQPTEAADRSLITAPDAIVEIDYREPDHARVHLRAAAGKFGAHDAAGVVSRAVAEARSRGIRDVDITLDPSAPSSATVLESLQECLASHADCLTMRRAGPSLLVRMRLRTASEAATGRAGVTE